MRFRDVALVISIQNYGEESAIVKVFSRLHGIRKGFVKNIHSKKNIYQIGNFIELEFDYKKDDSLGNFFYADLNKNYCGLLILHRFRFVLLQCLLDLLDAVLLENAVFSEIFDTALHFCNIINDFNCANNDLLASYIKIELIILQKLGYGLDFSKCIATGKSENLIFISPKSACAVCAEAGMPYADKLLVLPQFLLTTVAKIQSQQLQDGIKLTSFFLAKFLNYNSPVAHRFNFFFKI